MIDFEENLSKVRKSTSHSILPNKERVKIRLALEDGTEMIVITLTNVFYFPNSPSNLVSLGLLNNARIFHYNKDQTRYDQKIRKIFTFTQYYNTSFFLHLLNLSIAAVSLLKHNNIYESKKPNIDQMQDKKLSFTCWHECLGQLNFI